MRLRTIVAFVAGYYLGAKAGRTRYVQMKQAADRAMETPAAKRVKAVADLAVERVRDTLED